MAAIEHVSSFNALKTSRKTYGGMSEMSTEETPLLRRVISTMPQLTPSKSQPPVFNQAIAAVKGPLAVYTPLFSARWLNPLERTG